MATAIDANDADEQLNKSIWRLLSIRYTIIRSVYEKPVIMQIL